MQENMNSELQQLGLGLLIISGVAVWTWLLATTAVRILMDGTNENRRLFLLLCPIPLLGLLLLIFG